MQHWWSAAIAGAAAATVALALRGPAAQANWPGRAPFLGGSEPRTHAWQRFHVRYYPMTLLFIAFEMEMMFMYPWAVVCPSSDDLRQRALDRFGGIGSLG